MRKRNSLDSRQNDVLDVFKANPKKEISNKYLIRNLENIINKNTIYGSIARLKKAKKIIWVRPGVHILNQDDEIQNKEDSETMPISDHERILKKYSDLRNKIDELLSAVSNNVFKQLSTDMENVSQDDRQFIICVILQIMEFTIDLELDEQEKQWIKDL